MRDPENPDSRPEAVDQEGWWRQGRWYQERYTKNRKALSFLVFGLLFLAVNGLVNQLIKPKEVVEEGAPSEPSLLVRNGSAFSLSVSVLNASVNVSNRTTTAEHGLPPPSTRLLQSEGGGWFNADKRSIDAWDGSLEPPEYCFSSPKGRKVKPAPAPRKGALPVKFAKEVLQLLGKDRECIIQSRKCANETTRRIPYYHRYFDKSSKLTEEEKIMKFPTLSPGEWGSCAIVGNGDNMLKGQYGKEIDDHDYVARYNVITKPYAKAVGTKVSGMFDKFNYRIGPHKPDRMPTKYHMYPKRTPRDMRADLMKGGVAPLVYGSGKSPWRRDAAAIYEIFKKVKKPKKKDVHPTGGFARVMSMVEMVNLGVCSRLDIYGFSEGGGKYFKRKHTVKTDHIIIAEHFSYRLLMVSGIKGKICIYGD